MKHKESMTHEMSSTPTGPSIKQYLIGFLNLMLQLILGAFISAAAFLLSWAVDKLADKFKGSPLSVAAGKIISFCILGAGVVSIVVFTYATTRDFVKSMLRKDNQGQTSEQGPEAKGISK